MDRNKLALIAFLAISPAIAEPSPMASSGNDPAGSIGSSSRLASIALRYEGMTGPQLGLSARLWCAEFSNMVRRKAGLPAPASRRAFDQVQHARKISRPVPGALMITGRGRRGGHVDIVVQVHGDGTLTVVGGNVQRRVTLRRVAARGVFALPG